jgi:lysylphosphatidylglycerol synthetase-like protein (DUF2156 family)
MKTLIGIAVGFMLIALVLIFVLLTIAPMIALGLLFVAALIFILFGQRRAYRKFMPVGGARFAIAIVLIATFACGGSFCATTQRSTNAPSTAAQPSSSGTNWATMSQFYHTYVAGLIAPVGLAVATIADPSAGPAIALASKEVGNLDNLLAAKASDTSVAAQAAIVDKAVTDASSKVGSVLAAAQAATNPGVAPAVPTQPATPAGSSK